MQTSYHMLERRRKAVLKKMAKVGPFLMATPTYLMVRCGHPKCPCARNPKKRHEKLHLSWTEAEGKSGTLYVPVALREEVHQWIANYWTLKEMMREMTGFSRKMIRLYVKTRGRMPRRT